MGEISIKNGAVSQKPKKKKMPGFLKFLITLVCIILGLALVIVAATYICFYDAGHKEIENKENYTTEAVFNEIMVDSLDNTVSNEKITFALTESHLNQVIYSAFEGSDEIKQYLNNFYVEANDGKFDFVIEANAYSIFKSRLILNTELDISDDVLEFQVKNVTLGRISGLNNLVNLITTYIPIPDINASFAQAGLHLDFDIKALKITYLVDDFYSDMFNLLGGASNEYMDVFKEIISKESLRTISATGKNLFALDVNLDQLNISDTTLGIDGYSVPNGYFDAITPGILNDVKTLLNQDKILDEDKGVVANYFMGEDTLLNSSEMTIIQAYQEQGVLTGYTAPRYDYTADISDELKEKLTDQITKPIPTTHETIRLSSADLDKMFATSSALGKLNLFARDENLAISTTKNYKINYVTIDRITTAFKDNKFFIILSINFNGQSGQITLELEKLSGASNFGELKLNINNVYLGDTSVSTETKNSFISIVKSALGSGSFNNLISIDDNNVFTLSIGSVLDENGVLESLGYSTSFSFESTTSVVDGNLVIEAIR